MVLGISPPPCEYMFSLVNFIVNNQEHFQTNSAIHSANARKENHLHRPVAKLSRFQKSAYCSGIKMFNSLPSIHKNTNVLLKSSIEKVHIPLYRGIPNVSKLLVMVLCFNNKLIYCICMELAQQLYIHVKHSL
jgi:hypothetical protein